MTITQSKVHVASADVADHTNDYVTMTIADQLFGIPVLTVQDVLAPQRITRIPLAPPEVAGSLNLRGRIVTAIDMRKRLGLPPKEKAGHGMSIVVEYEGEAYSLLVDEVGEVLSLSASTYERNPVTIDARWRGISSGLYPLEGCLLIVFNIAALFGNLPLQTA